jgi:anti-sigma factor RsiW
MNCQECHDFIDPYIDNELDVAAAILVKQHLRDCSQCQPLLESRKALRALLNNPQLQFEVPDSLRRRIQSALPAATSSARQKSGGRSVIPWYYVPLALAAAFAVMLGLLFLNQGKILDRSRGNALVEEVVSSHVRSLLATHLLDVPSTDQHTVKPWFDGKLKFSPPVRDFADQGFRLIGGRLDYINGREVAALVYQRRLHIINLFIWPLESGLNTASESFTKDGYNVSHWERDGFAFWAVSDGGSEIMHFQVWHDKAGNATPLTGDGITFVDLTKNQPETLQANLIMPEPCDFISTGLPQCAIIRPTSPGQLDARGAINGFIADGLFIGQQRSKEFLDLIIDMAEEADAARRELEE